MFAGRMMSLRLTAGSAIASYVLRPITVCSRKEMLLFACGSRSISNTLRPRMARAAARFTAVVVFPTPPFWFAMATIKSTAPPRRVGVCRSQSSKGSWAQFCEGNAPIVETTLPVVNFSPVRATPQFSGKQKLPIPPALGIGSLESGVSDCRPADISHLVFRKLCWIKCFQPLLNLVVRQTFGAEVHGLRVLDDGLFHKNRRAGAKCQRNGVARSGVNGHSFAADGQVHDCVERVLLEVVDDYSIDAAVKVGDDVLEQVVRHRPRRDVILDLQGDGVRLEQPDPDRQYTIPVLVLQDHDRGIGDGVQHKPLDRHLYQHGGRSLRMIGACGPVWIASPRRLCGPPRVIRTGTVRPIHGPFPDGVSVGAGKFTTVFPIDRPESSARCRRLTESTSTSTMLPTACSCSPV